MDIDVVRAALQRRYDAYEDGEWFTLSYVAGGSLKNEHFQVKNVEGAVALVVAVGDTDIYSTMGVFGKEPGPGRKGTAAEIARCAWLWVDLDCHNNEPCEPLRERLEAFVPHPTMTVFSGRGYHGYWAIRPVCPDRAAIEERNNWLAIQLGGDHVFNWDRIMRVPGTVNTRA